MMTNYFTVFNQLLRTIFIISFKKQQTKFQSLKMPHYYQFYLFTLKEFKMSNLNIFRSNSRSLLAEKIA